MLETKYQANVIKELKKTFPGCFVQKNDPKDRQGLPDLLILYRNRWAMLEVKQSKDASIRPNQEHYVAEFGRMSYASFIYPENQEIVFDELRRVFFS